jgi:hypothetical protein
MFAMGCWKGHALSLGFTQLHTEGLEACAHLHMSHALHEALSTQFKLTLTSTCLGLGLIYLGIIEWSRYTPSLRTGNV